MALPSTLAILQIVDVISIQIGWGSFLEPNWYYNTLLTGFYLLMIPITLYGVHDLARPRKEIEPSKAEPITTATEPVPKAEQASPESQIERPLDEGKEPKV